MLAKYRGLKTINEWKKYLQDLLRTKDKALLKSVILIYDMQTEEEKSLSETFEHNGVGFSGSDAEFLSSIAKQIKNGKELSPKQLAITRNKMLRYWKQLMHISKDGIAIEKRRAQTYYIKEDCFGKHSFDSVMCLYCPKRSNCYATSEVLKCSG